MAKKKDKFGLGRRIVNVMASRMAAHGIGLSSWYLLSVPGRKTGVVRSTPLVVIQVGDDRYMVASYGVVDWVKNVRAADQIALSRKRRSDAFRAIEVEPAEAAPVLREYIRHIRVARPYFDAGVDAPLDAFVREARGHPVFRLDPLAVTHKPD